MYNDEEHLYHDPYGKDSGTYGGETGGESRFPETAAVSGGGDAGKK